MSPQSPASYCWGSKELLFSFSFFLWGQAALLYLFVLFGALALFVCFVWGLGVVRQGLTVVAQTVLELGTPHRSLQRASIISISNYTHLCSLLSFPSPLETRSHYITPLYNPGWPLNR